MAKYVALLRGINVGSKNIVVMATLRDLCHSIGWLDVESYIQSGNLVFEAEAPQASDLVLAMETKLGIAPHVLVLSKGEFANIVQNCPFESQTGKDVHVFFLDGASEANVEKLNALASPSEKWSLGEFAFYLYAPDGIGRSKLAAGAEQALGVKATARNWNTVMKLHSMLQ